MMAASSWTLVGLFLSTLLDAAQLQRDCSPPPQYPNAKLLETPPRHKFADGDKVVYSCARDYSATPGRMWLRCNNGEWTKLAGKCEKGPTSCSPPKVSNSAPSETSVFQVGQSAIITCSPGFQLDGAQKITCDRSGQWQPEPPQCRPSRTVEKQQATTDGGCAAPRDVHDPNIHLAERYMTRETFKPNERVQFVCGVGYAPAEGSRFRRCIDGEWTPLLLQCERQLCGSAGEIPYGRFAYTGVQFGDTATAACDEGYRLVGQATRRCLSFGWDGRVPVCEAVQCDKPPVVANAEHNGPLEPPYMFRTVVQYHCHVGAVIGSKDVWCTKDGTWSSTPRCKEGPTSCSPPKVSNSAPSETSVFQVGQSAIITCSPGFQLDGAQKITCDRSGQWQPEPPQCRPSRTVEKQQATTDGGCAAPRDVHDPNIHLAERYMTRETFKHNERVQFVCGVGYAPAGGSRFRRCIDGEWTPLLLQCERQLCGSAGEIPYGRFAYTGVQFGDTATAACDEGYRLVGQATRRCLSFGWDGRVPVCEAVQCDKPPVVANAEHNGPLEPPYMFRTVVQYHCHVGAVVGSKDVWCTKDGTWSGTPRCKEITCPRPRVPYAVWDRSAAKRYQYRDTLSVVCRRGYTLRGPSSITCDERGRWFPAVKCWRRFK